jgi:protocadherin Fat 1/2/3
MKNFVNYNCFEGSVPLESHANVTIKMVSGGMPLFKHQYYAVSVIESHPPSVPFLTINADSPHGRQLIYSIVSGNDNEEFSLDFNSGMFRR